METQVSSLGQEDPLEKEMATHSSIPAWEIPRTEKPGGLQSLGSKKIHDLAIKQHQTNTNNYTAGKWSQPGVGKLWPTGQI